MEQLHVVSVGPLARSSMMSRQSLFVDQRASLLSDFDSVTSAGNSSSNTKCKCPYGFSSTLKDEKHDACRASLIL